MAKKDFGNTEENIDREAKESACMGSDADSSNEKSATEVKNANATGVGAMGRNEEKEVIDSPDKSTGSKY